MPPASIQGKQNPQGRLIGGKIMEVEGLASGENLTR